MNGKYFQAANLKAVAILIHNFPIKNETKRKKNQATVFGQLICKPFILLSIVLVKSIFL